MPQTNKVGGPVHRSILDGIITGIFGPNTDEMSTEDAAATERARQKQSNEALQMADSARKNPGAEFIAGPPTSGGSTDILKMIGGIVKFFGG